MNNNEFTISFFPNGTPVPEVLTEEEAIHFLRLDVDGPKHPELSLQYYRREGLLAGIKLGKRLRYTKTELLEFLERLTKINNKNISDAA
jgi:hypothetical protein